MIDVVLFVVEWLGAVLLGLSILWYPVKTGWRRLGAPLVGVFGCLGFLIVGVHHGIWGVAALNGLMALFNGWNLFKAWREHRYVMEELNGF